MRSCDYAGLSSSTITYFLPYYTTRISFGFTTGPRADGPISVFYYHLALWRTRLLLKLNANIVDSSAIAIDNVNVNFNANAIVNVISVDVDVDFGFDFVRSLDIVHDSYYWCSCYPKY